MLLLGSMPVYQSPAGDDEGGGDESGRRATAPADDDDDTDDDDDESPADDDDDDDPDDDDGANKRIRQLNEKKNAAEARCKDLEKQLDEAKKLSGDDGRALLAAAEASGILPGLMTKAEAEAFQDMHDLPYQIEQYRDWLDDHDKEDELELGNDKTMRYGDVKKRVRKLEAQLDDLKDRYGSRRRELQQKVREIFELGVSAQKAGWKPDAPKKTAQTRTKKSKTTPDRATVRPTRTSHAKADEMDVDDGDSLESFFMENRRKKN